MLREDHRRGWLGLMGEGLDGRTHLLSDSDFMDMNIALRTDEDKEDGKNPTIGISN